MYWKIL